VIALVFVSTRGPELGTLARSCCLVPLELDLDGPVVPLFRKSQSKQERWW